MYRCSTYTECSTIYCEVQVSHHPAHYLYSSASDLNNAVAFKYAAQGSDDSENKQLNENSLCEEEPD